MVSHVAERVYRVFASDLNERALPADLVKALGTMDPKPVRGGVFDCPHSVDEHADNVHFAEVMYLGHDGLVKEPLAIFPD